MAIIFPTIPAPTAGTTFTDLLGVDWLFDGTRWGRDAGSTVPPITIGIDIKVDPPSDASVTAFAQGDIVVFLDTDETYKNHTGANGSLAADWVKIGSIDNIYTITTEGDLASIPDPKPKQGDVLVITDTDEKYKNILGGVGGGLAGDWELISSSSLVLVQDTPPVTPVVGLEWLDTKRNLQATWSGTEWVCYTHVEEEPPPTLPIASPDIPDQIGPKDTPHTHDMRQYFLTGGFVTIWSLQNAPGWATIDIDTGVLSWNSPTAGTYPDVTVTGTNSVGNDVSNLFDIIVTSTEFIFNVDTTVNKYVSIDLPGPNSCTIDWGEGAAPQPLTGSGSIPHTYTTSGIFQVVISGSISSFQAVNTSRIVEIVNWGNVGITTANSMFSMCDTLTTISATDTFGAGISDFSFMFKKCTNLGSFNSTFDTSSATTFQDMFDRCQLATTIDCSSFDTSNALNFSGMFTFCTSAVTIITPFDTSSATDMSLLFNNIGGSLTTVDISSFDTTNVTAYNSMFYNVFNVPELDISNFNTSSGLNFSSMFDNTAGLTCLKGSFDTTNGTNMTRMFSGSPHPGLVKPDAAAQAALIAPGGSTWTNAACP